MTLLEFMSKMKGGGAGQQTTAPIDMLWSWLGSVIGIAACGLLSTLYFESRDATLLIGSFGASAVLIYAAIKSPLAQPRNLLGGHVISAVVGVAVVAVAAAASGADIAVGCEGWWCRRCLVLPPRSLRRVCARAHTHT